MPDSFDGFCSLWPGANPQGEDKGYASYPPAIFKNIFDAYNFSIISNRFDNYKPYALNTHTGN